MADFHFLLHLACNELFALTVRLTLVTSIRSKCQTEALQPLLQAVRDGDAAKAEQWKDATHQWSTIEILASHVRDEPPRMSLLLRNLTYH